MSILKILEIIVRSWKTIVRIVGGAMIIGLILAFVVSREYVSTARVLAPKETNLLSGISGLSSLVRSLPAGLRLGVPEDPYDFVAILRSRTILEAVVKQFGLVEVYDVPESSMEKATKHLREKTEIDWTEEGTLELRVWDEDAVRASEIANFYVELLNERNVQLRTQEARNTRMFIEKRIRQNQRDMFVAESLMQSYQEKKQMIVSLDPSAAGISTIAELYGAKTKKEVELEILAKSVGDRHPQYLQTKLELESFRSKIVSIPEIGVESLRLFRDVMIQQKIMEIVVPLYEQAKVNEQKNIPIAYVLDPAIPGERPERPKRILVVGIATFLGMIWCVVFISFREYFNAIRESSPGEWNRFSLIRQSLRLRSKT